MSTLSFKAAAMKILQESKRPLSTAEIYEAAVAQGLIKSSGETPVATMGALIYTDIKKRSNIKEGGYIRGILTIKQGESAGTNHSGI